MEENEFGVEIEGDWEKVVEQGEDIKKSLEETDSIEEEEVEKWEEWRPKKEEDVEKMKNKSIEKTMGDKEKKTEEAQKELENAKDKFNKAAESGNEVARGSLSLTKNFLSGLNNFLKFLKSYGLQLFIALEKVVYEKITTKYSPKYFETDEFNSNIEEKSNLSKDNNYELEVLFENKEKRKEIKENLREIQDKNQDDKK